MEIKKISYSWAVVVGLLSILAQIVYYNYRFATLAPSEFNLLVV